MFNLFKNKNQPPLQSSAVLRVIGDRSSGKTTYMASLARWPNADPDSPVQAVTAVNEGGEKLLSQAQNILEQGLELERTPLALTVSDVNDCTLQITLKEKKLGSKLLNLNISSKDYSGEFFDGLLHQSKNTQLDEYLEDCLRTKKIAGAINAIRQFTKISGERGGNTQISIVPFGKAGSKCPESPVNEETLDKFLAANDFKLQNNLDYLSSLSPCASTDLYEPLTTAVKFLANTKDSRFYLPENSSQPQPRLSIILLSDGYHNALNEATDFAALTKLLQRKENITVHTLGYGLTPQELGVKYKLGRPATRADLNKRKVPEAEFVDQQRLAEIAKLTGGIAEFSGNAERIAENLQLFLNALLGEYEITFTQPNAERGSKHKVQVKVSSQDGKAKESQTIEYIMPVFGRSLPLGVRLIMVISVLFIVIIFGIVPFHYWGKHLKAEAQRD